MALFFIMQVLKVLFLHGILLFLANKLLIKTLEMKYFFNKTMYKPDFEVVNGLFRLNVASSRF